MNHKLRIVGSVSLICLAVLVFGIMSYRSHMADSAVEIAQTQSEVTYSGDAWPDEIAGPAMAHETAAILDAENDAEAKHITAESTDSTAPAIYYDSGYELTDYERMTVERIVMCEAGGEGERGQMMVAQCILEGLLRYDYSIEEYIRNYKVMLTSYSNVTDEVRTSVSRVFDDGERVIEERADLWYNPAITASEWHEAQEYVITIGSHRFFWMIDDTHT